ncbi:MAG: large-conductance mechanosensitive channel protein MscL [Planctomycetota bacterium]|nr:large-conductance mechanosensitive channel protein MscL [Planctomycetota bacterium]
MSIVKEFRDFAVRGNVFDMAVGVIIGGAFGKLAGSFVSDIMMPPIGMAAGKVDFSDQKLILQEAAPEVKDAGGVVTQAAIAEVAITYGKFISVCIDFFLMALAVFILVKIVNKLKGPVPAPPPPGPTPDQKLLTEIRDLLARQQ